MWFWPTLVLWCKQNRTEPNIRDMAFNTDVQMETCMYRINTCWVGQYRTCTLYTYTVFLAGKSPKIRSYTVNIYGSSQP